MVGVPQERSARRRPGVPAARTVPVSHRHAGAPCARRILSDARRVVSYGPLSRPRRRHLCAVALVLRPEPCDSVESLHRRRRDEGKGLKAQRRSAHENVCRRVRSATSLHITAVAIGKSEIENCICDVRRGVRFRPGAPPPRPAADARAPSGRLPT
ncbi:hypothetical protein EVAR_22905_1 [Eumeta japonica]|uniref:Uncharacterized protein n=1 Tax=Eumeta variegata TaxID=151549 RepID=A0A4C1UU93_EUMVA|nr:hypothetical protein EVAR_22905_1 [Eumeta japonica]